VKAVKIIAAVLGAIVALLVIASLVIASFFDPNDYKGVVADAFAARTGRTLAIDQDLRLRFFPWLAVETGGITVGGSAAFADAAGATPPFATIERASARVKVLPLLSRQFQVGTVEIDGLTLNLARDAQLRGNWQDLVDAAKGAGGAAAPPAEPGASPARTFALEGVRLRDGTIHWSENTSELRYTVSGLDLSTGAIGAGDPVTVDLALRFANEASGLTAQARVTATAHVAGDAVTARDLDADFSFAAGGGAPPREIGVTLTSLAFDRTAQTLDVQGLTTEVAGVKAQWQLQGSALLDSPAVQGAVSVAGAPLATVLAALDLPPPAGVEPAELGDFSLAAQFGFRAEPREVRLTNVDAALLGMTIRGEGTLAGDDELAGRIELPQFAPSKAVQSLLRAAVPPTVDVSALDQLALRTSFTANLTTGQAALRDLHAQVFGATIDAELQAIPGQRGNTFRGSVTTSRFAPDAFAKAFAGLLPKQISPGKLGMVQAKAQFAMDTGADTVSVPSFEAELFGLKGSGEVTGRNISTAASWTGRAHVAQFSPQDLIQRFGLPPQPTSDPKALTRATVDMRFEADKSRARFADVALALDDSKITGDFALEGFGADPLYRFTLAVDRVDADRYLPPKARDAKQGEATAGDLELPANNTMRLDGTMQIGDLKLAGMQFQAVGSRIVIGGGDAKLENARARLYGGEFNGNFHVRAAGNEPGLALDGHASGLQLQPLIEALTGKAANFSGTGQFDLDLAGRGRTVIENVGTASGNVGFSMTNGAVKGFDLGRALCAAWNVTQRAPGPAGEDSKRTAYEAIKGTAMVSGGSAHSSDLLARTSFMDVYGAGTLGLVDQRLDYNLDAKLTGKIPITNCNTMDKIVGESIPFDIEGTVTEPSITPDYSKILQRVLRDQVQDRLKDRLRDLLD
jgi:AsmA protein